MKCFVLGLGLTVVCSAAAGESAALDNHAGAESMTLPAPPGLPPPPPSLFPPVAVRSAAAGESAALDNHPGAESMALPAPPGLPPPPPSLFPLSRRPHPGLSIPTP